MNKKLLTWYVPNPHPFFFLTKDMLKDLKLSEKECLKIYTEKPRAARKKRHKND